ncbi:hypothetical protein [Pontibacter populi]|uniref:Uncharacterized protein n=1 Tax=Pontibacter populi TaxID=890055 RepID=A0ABV1RUF7_9BACT
MALKSQIVSINKSKLIIHIDNDWSSNEFLKLFEAITCLYDYHFLLERAIYSYNSKGDELNWSQSLNSLPEVQYHRESLKKSAFRILNNSADYSLEDALMSIGGGNLVTLQVNKIKFGSRGNIDLIGLGKVFEIIRDLIIHYLPNKNQKIENELKEQEVISAKI